MLQCLSCLEYIYFFRFHAMGLVQEQKEHMWFIPVQYWWQVEHVLIVRWHCSILRQLFSSCSAYLKLHNSFIAQHFQISQDMIRFFNTFHYLTFSTRNLKITTGSHHTRNRELNRLPEHAPWRQALHWAASLALIRWRHWNKLVQPTYISSKYLHYYERWSDKIIFFCNKVMEWISNFF